MNRPVALWDTSTCTCPRKEVANTRFEGVNMGPSIVRTSTTEGCPIHDTCQGYTKAVRAARPEWSNPWCPIHATRDLPRGQTMNQQVALSVPEDVWAQVKAKAALQGQTRSQAASEAFREWVKLPARTLPPRTDQWLDELRDCGAKGTMAANCLMREHVADRAALDAIPDEDLLKMRNFGPSQLLLLYQIGWRAKP